MYIHEQLSISHSLEFKVLGFLLEVRRAHHLMAGLSGYVPGRQDLQELGPISPHLGVLGRISLVCIYKFALLDESMMQAGRRQQPASCKIAQAWTSLVDVSRAKQPLE